MPWQMPSQYFCGGSRGARRSASLSESRSCPFNGVTVAAVKWHLQHIYEKLHVHSRTEAALKFKQGQGS